MFGLLKTAFSPLTAGITKLAGAGLKPIRYFIDSHFRDHVTPVAGSVVYSDLYFAVEHSGIYLGDGQISNIVVDNLLAGDSTVRISDPSDFTEKSKLGKKIYVSCDKHGAVGDFDVSNFAERQVGERSYYGLVFSNCHTFSTKCVNVSPKNPSFFIKLFNTFGQFLGTDSEPTLARLKTTAKNNLGATKWRLWDWDNTAKDTPEPDWNAINEAYKNQALDPQFIEQLRQELADTLEYEDELSNETIPKEIRQKLRGFGQTLTDISDKYEEMKDFLATCPEAKLSYNQIKNNPIDFQQLANELKNNANIQELARKMGRNYISEQKKKTSQILHASKSEVHGTHRSDDLMRLLPNELINLEDDTLEMLFYARLLEKGLLTYELQGVTPVTGETFEEEQKRTGPVVACLDTSASMAGQPLMKAKALLFAIANILTKEQRSLHVILFGSSGETKEFTMNNGENVGGLLNFLQQGFGGGTDFETPLKRAVSIIKKQPDYKKADILMISDGDCQLSSQFSHYLNSQKHELSLSIYSVLCAGSRVADNFSDEVVVL